MALAPQKSPGSEAPRKSAGNTPVDAPAQAKPFPAESGVLKPSGEEPTPTPAVGSSPPTDEEAQSDEETQSDEEAQSEEDKDRAANQGAYNPETGEINWDCPCLGGMAHGPCGPQFREAFSCFVYSNEDPKGVDCVEKFKAMQDCFREHPDVYGEEIDDDDDDGTVEELEESEAPVSRPDGESLSSEKRESAENSKLDTTSSVPPPSSAPPSRANAPTANVSPDTTPTERGRS
ncbi:Oxidoreductase [Ceratobasidium sp. 414]|nr:Oxidoreductase [Ceratobasidium sp. 414]